MEGCSEVVPSLGSAGVLWLGLEGIKGEGVLLRQKGKFRTDCYMKEPKEGESEGQAKGPGTVV